MTPDFSKVKPAIESHTPSLWDTLLMGGPWYILFHLLFAASIVVAVTGIIQRRPLPWMLLASCMPFIWGAAASNYGYNLDLATVTSIHDQLFVIAQYSHDIHLYKWAYTISIVLVILSLMLRGNTGKPKTPGMEPSA